MTIEYTCCDEDDDFDVEAFLNRVRVGYAWGIRDGDRVRLSDIHVAAHPPGLRGKGIGRELLMKFLAKADEAGIREVWGFVTADDLKQTPKLLDWYVRHGFSPSEPDGECLKNAVKKIVRLRT